MKKMSCILMAAALFMPLIVGAVTWTGDSNQFKWTDGTPVLGSHQQAVSQVNLQYRPEFSKGAVTFLYELPSQAQGAKLVIYNVSGSLIRDFDLEPGKGSVRWFFTGDRSAAGVYVACMRYGSADKKIQIAIVK
jgi:hypothetical protein